MIGQIDRKLAQIHFRLALYLAGNAGALVNTAYSRVLLLRFLSIGGYEKTDTFESFISYKRAEILSQLAPRKSFKLKVTHFKNTLKNCAISVWFNNSP